MAGCLGAFTVALTSTLLLPFCAPKSGPGAIYGKLTPGLEEGSGWTLQEKVLWMLAITLWGSLGSLLDSALGGWFQASVVDSRTGKVVEGSGGKKASFIESIYLKFVLMNNFRSLLLSRALRPAKTRRLLAILKVDLAYWTTTQLTF